MKCPYHNYVSQKIRSRTIGRPSVQVNTKEQCRHPEALEVHKKPFWHLGNMYDLKCGADIDKCELEGGFRHPKSNDDRDVE